VGRVSIWLLALGICLCGPASAFAKPAPIVGKLSKPGYTVIALGYNGKAVSSRSRSFRIVPGEAKVTLQLRSADGRYAGPVVVGGTGSKVVVGVKAGAQLGTIRVQSGYAKLAKAVAAKAVDRRRTAQARKGVPLGTGRNFGLVRSAKQSAAGAGRDMDLDGVPDTLDIDANGNLVLNNEESGTGSRARAAQTGGSQTFSVFSQIGARLDGSVNANAAGVSDAAVDALVQGSTSPPTFQPIGMFLDFHVLDGEQVELDCGGLTYCSNGGTGRVRPPDGRDPGPSFPSCCDPDGDGFGTMTSTPGPGGPEMVLYPIATAAQIRSGDLMIQRVTTGGVETEVPGTLNFVFNTTPALTSWTSSGGQSGSVSYPVSRGAPGTTENPFPVGAGPDGKVVVTMTFWRPQRRAIEGAGEGTGFIDLGHLRWSSRLVKQQTVADCQVGYSTTDPNLSAGPDPMLGGFVDNADDAPANPANTVTYSLDFSACLASKNATWSSGDSIQLEIVARSQGGGDNSAQQVIFKRQ
jgi:hypothetical protein